MHPAASVIYQPLFCPLHVLQRSTWTSTWSQWLEYRHAHKLVRHALSKATPVFFLLGQDRPFIDTAVEKSIPEGETAQREVALGLKKIRSRRRIWAAVEKRMENWINHMDAFAAGTFPPMFFSRPKMRQGGGGAIVPPKCPRAAGRHTHRCGWGGVSHACRSRSPSTSPLRNRMTFHPTLETQ
jgi:hypothetical protein